MEPVTVVTALIEQIKKARAVAERLKNAEMMAVLLDAQEKTLSLKEELLNLRAENIALKEKMAGQAAKKALSFDGHVYWSGEPGDPANGPFCPRCVSKDSRHSPMTDRGNGFSCCVVCDHCVDNTVIDKYPKLHLSTRETPTPP